VILLCAGILHGMDPITIAGGGLAVLGSKEVIGKLLGPTAEYLGAELRTYTEKGVTNLRRIFEHGVRRAGASLEEPGQVPPKVLKNILTEGYFCEDELGAEYFGGVIAASRTGISRDDRGAAIVALIARLSTYQLRAHYVFYTALKNLYDGSKVNLGRADDCTNACVFFSTEAFFEAMDFSVREDVNAIVPHILFGLSKEGLISPFWAARDPAGLREILGVHAPQTGIVVIPATLGVELFYWAYGLGNRRPSDFFQPEILFEPLAEIELPAAGVEKVGKNPS
jgi:hypothetical protein